METRTLNNGVVMPALGFGVFQTPPDETRDAVQEGRSVIPKSTKPARIAENIGVFDFKLTAEEIAAIDRLDTGHRGGPDPAAVTLEAYGRDIPEA
jgi:diketogulonate reductase-like aldo/keto reductase